MASIMIIVSINKYYFKTRRKQKINLLICFLFDATTRHDFQSSANADGSEVAMSGRQEMCCCVLDTATTIHHHLAQMWKNERPTTRTCEADKARLESFDRGGTEHADELNERKIKVKSHLKQQRIPIKAEVLASFGWVWCRYKYVCQRWGEIARL